MLFKEAVSSNLLELVLKIQSIVELRNFHLVGGTAMALMKGHRKSVDIDLFTDKSIDRIALQKLISEKFRYVDSAKHSGMGMIFFINGIKVDFCNDGGKFIREEIKEDGLRLASPEDIAAMKMSVISDRAKKKDFYDIAVLMDQFSVKEMIRFFHEKYPFMDIRPSLEALKKHYKADGDKNIIPLIALTWDEAKARIDKQFDIYLSELKTRKEIQIHERLKNAQRMIRNKNKNK